MSLTIPPTLNLTISNFITSPLFTSTPYCSVPATSLNERRIATLTSLPVSDCGTCISLCVTNGIENCLDVLLVASNEIISVGDNSTATSASISNSTVAGNRAATFEITAQNPLTGAIDGATHTEAHVMEGERCSGVWDGTVLVDGSLPLGRFAEYMLMGPAGDLNANSSVGVTAASAENARVGVTAAQNFTKRIEAGEESAGVFDGKDEGDDANGKGKGKGQPKPKGHGRPIPPAEGVKALGKRSNATDVKPPVTVTGPVFSPPTGAEYMVDKGFMERQGGASGRRFGG